MNKIRIATVFSGIGSIEFAFRRLGIDNDIVFACDNGERDIEYDISYEFAKIKSLSGPVEKRDYVEKLYNEKTRKHNFVMDSYLANYHVNNDLFFQDIKLYVLYCIIYCFNRRS